MKKRNFQLRTTAIFKCIITLKNGAHKIVRMTIDNVARLVNVFKEQQANVFQDESYLFYLSEDEALLMKFVVGMKIINERTGQELLSL